MEFEIKNAEFQQKTAQEVRIRSDSGNGVDQPQTVTVSMKAEAPLHMPACRDSFCLPGTFEGVCPGYIQVFDMTL